MLNEGRQELCSYLGVVRKTISTASTNAEALREMMSKNLEALVVADQDNRLKGIAEREQILTKMVLDMTQYVVCYLNGPPWLSTVEDRDGL